MRIGSRELLLSAGLLLASVAGSEALAQCMACTSSHACGSSSTRGGCQVQCAQTTCSCSDGGCIGGGSDPKPEEPAISMSYEGPGARLAVAGEAFAVVDCQGNFATMAYTPERAEALERSLGLIALSPARPSLARAGRAFRAERSDE